MRSSILSVCYDFIMKKYLIFLPIILAGIIAYFPSLKYGFSQDDFIFLYISKAQTFSQFLNFFNPFAIFPDFFFYRPLTTQVFYSVNQSLFGLNPLPSHIAGLTLHLINSILFFFIIQKVWQNKQVAFLSALFFAISAAHFLSLYYIAAFQEVGRIFFVFLSLLLFLSYLDTKKELIYLGSLVAFILAILSKETSLITPFLFLPIEILRRKEQSILKVAKNLLKTVIPFLVIILIYSVIRFLGFQSVFNEGSYNIVFSITEIFQNIKWYLLWSFGLPEIISSWPSLKPSSLLQFGQTLPFGYPVISLFILLLITLGINSFFRVRYLNKKTLIASLVIFLVSLGPVLILHQHSYPQYLDLAMLGFLPIIAWLLYPLNQEKNIFKLIGFLGIIFFITLQLTSLKLSEQTHWTTHRAIVADYYHQDFQKKYPSIPEGTEVIFSGNRQITYELSIALAKKYALLVWYPNKIKNVEYKTLDYQISHKEKTIVYPVSLY